MGDPIRVLLVDPEFRKQIKIQQMLADSGFLIVGFATEANEAITAAHEVQPDVIITKLPLPSVLHIASTRNNQLPTVEIVAIVEPESLDTKDGAASYALGRVKNAGIVEFVPTPVNESKLERAIRNAFGRRMSLAAREARDLVAKASTQTLETSSTFQQLLEEYEKLQLADAGRASSAMKEAQVFISYSRLDWTDYVEKLVTYLKNNGFNIWVDQHLIQGGDDWWDEINDALESCPVMVLCLSPNSLESRNVKIEYRYFVDEHKPIIPVMCRDTKLPAELRRIQYLPYDLASLVRRLRGLINGHR